MLGVDLGSELARDYNIIGMDVKPSAVNHQLSAFIKCDITDKDRIIKSARDAKPDLIIHTAAWTDVDGCEEEPEKAKKINQKGTENVAISTSELSIPLIYISTDFVFDGNKKALYTENDLPNPVNIYGKSKLEGEKKVAALNKYIILRTGWMFGVNGKNFVDTILDKAKAKKEIKVVDDQIGCPTYTKDFATAIGKLLSVVPIRDTREIYHITNKGAVTWFDYTKEIIKIRGVDNIQLVPIKSDQLNRPAKRPAFSVLDNSKFEKATGFVMRPWRDALREYINAKK